MCRVVPHGVSFRFLMAEQLLHAASTAIGVLHSWQSIRNVRRVLIYKLDHLGDVLLATPALRAIRRRFPEARIRIVVGEWSSAMLANNPNVDEVAIYNSRMFARFPYVSHDGGDLRRAVAGFNPDLIIGLRDDWRTLRYPFAPGVRRINRGRVHLQEWIQKKRGRVARGHEVDRIWRMLRPLGIEPEESNHLEYVVTDDERGEATETMVQRGIVDGFAVIHAGTSVPLKEWDLDRFAQTARYIARVYAMQIVLIGSPDEVDRSRELMALIGDLDPIDISGELNLRSTAALLEHAGLYLGSDGGAMHLATAVGVPTVGLFGPGSYHIFHPVGDHATAISHLFPCSPCNMITCIRPHDTCMQAITVDEVLRETDRILAGQSQADADLAMTPRRLR